VDRIIHNDNVKSSLEEKYHIVLYLIIQLLEGDNMDILELMGKIVQIIYYALNGVNLVIVIYKQRTKKRIHYRQRKWRRKQKRKRDHLR
jgi:amino acid transporter